MSKNRITALCVAFSIICSFACEDRKEEYPDIRIGKEKNVDELSLNKQTEKRLLVSGGNGKYIVNVENSQIATAQMSMDTLKVKGLLEGETFATVLSHDKRVRLKINVTFPELGISHPIVQLRPKDISKFVSISGGGERVTLQENDPADVMDIKWDGSTGMLEIMPKYEGEAEVTAISEDGKEQKTIHIKVKPEGELTVPGWYDTRNSSYYVMLNNKMIVRRKKSRHMDHRQRPPLWRIYHNLRRLSHQDRPHCESRTRRFHRLECPQLLRCAWKNKSRDTPPLCRRGARIGSHAEGERV
ncbi:hypothetical protein NXX78_10020 [Bacteroides fragilis]|nr:hypothetical protein [Bacteroides fragilis]